MTPDFVAVSKEWTIRRVLEHVRTHGKDSETLNVLYVVDQGGTLHDDLRIRNVLLAPMHTHVGDLMDGKFVALNVTDDKLSAVEVFRKLEDPAVVQSQTFPDRIASLHCRIERADPRAIAMEQAHR